MSDDEDATNRPNPARHTFVRLLGFLRPYRASLVVSSLLAIGSQIAGILVPVLIGSSSTSSKAIPTSSFSPSRSRRSSRSASYGRA